MKNFCHRPWTEMHIEENGNITPCCVMPSNIHFVANGIKNYQNSSTLKEIKQGDEITVKYIINKLENPNWEHEYEVTQ